MKRVYKTPLMKSVPTEKKVGIEDLQPDLAASLGDYPRRTGDASSVVMDFNQDSPDYSTSAVLNNNIRNNDLGDLMKTVGVTTIDDLATVIESGKGGGIVTGQGAIIYCGKQEIYSEYYDGSGVEIPFADGEHALVSGNVTFPYNTRIRMWYSYPWDVTVVSNSHATSAMTFNSFVGSNLEIWDDYSRYYPQRYPEDVVEVPVLGNVGTIPTPGLIILDIQAWVGGADEIVVPLPDHVKHEVFFDHFDYTWSAEYYDSQYGSYGIVNVHCFDYCGRQHAIAPRNEYAIDDPRFYEPHDEAYMFTDKYSQIRNGLLLKNTGDSPAKVRITLKAYPQLDDARKIAGGHIYSLEDGCLFIDI